MGHPFYEEHARWWPLISPVEDYVDEAAEVASLLRRDTPHVRTVLELGSGGGHNAAHLKAHFALTLVDLSEAMLTLSRALNPGCEHGQGDMRTVRLGRTFDAVFVHDAIDYMRFEDDLHALMRTVVAHLGPGGVVLLAPDHVREGFEASTDHGGHDAPDGRGVRYLEWSWDPDPDDTTVCTAYAFVFREADGTTTSAHEVHTTGLFATATWLAVMQAHGLVAEAVVERTDEDRPPRTLFLGRRTRNDRVA